MAATDRFIDLRAIERLSRPDTSAEFAGADDSAVISAQNEAAACRQKISDAVTSFTAGRVGIEVVEAVTAQLAPKAEAAEARAVALRTPSTLTGLTGDDAALVKLTWGDLPIAAARGAAA